MIYVKDLDYSLSLKLGDPITIATNNDGMVFSAIDRLNYMQRAYSRLIRTLSKLMNIKTPLFAQSKSVHKIDTDKFGDLGRIMSTGKDIKLYIEDTDPLKQSAIEDVYEILLTIRENTKSEYTSFATFITPDKFLSVRAGKSDSYTPSLTSKKFYYTFLSNAIQLLPVLNTPNKYTSIEIVYRTDTPVLLWDSIIAIPNEYIDLLLAMAANEAMQDIGRQDKVQLYTNDIIGQLNILSQYAQISQQKEGSDING